MKPLPRKSAKTVFIQHGDASTRCPTSRYRSANHARLSEHVRLEIAEIAVDAIQTPFGGYMAQAGFQVRRPE